MEQAKYFVGKWTCTGTQAATPMGPEHTYKSKGDFKFDLGGYWLTWHVDQDKSKENPMPTSAAGSSTYDAASKKFVRSDFMSGGLWDTMSSPGWEGDVFAFTGDQMMMGKKVPIKHTITKKSETEWTSVFEMGTPDGKMMKFIDETCKKAGKK